MFSIHSCSNSEAAVPLYFGDRTDFRVCILSWFYTPWSGEEQMQVLTSVGHGAGCQGAAEPVPDAQQQRAAAAAAAAAGEGAAGSLAEHECSVGAAGRAGAVPAAAVAADALPVSDGDAIRC